MTPIEWLSTDAELQSARDADGGLFSPIKAFSVIDRTEKYDELSQSLGPGEIALDPDALARIRSWLLARPGCYSAVMDPAAVPVAL